MSVYVDVHADVDANVDVDMCYQWAEQGLFPVIPAHAPFFVARAFHSRRPSRGNCLPTNSLICFGTLSRKLKSTDKRRMERERERERERGKRERETERKRERERVCVNGEPPRSGCACFQLGCILDQHVSIMIRNKRQASCSL